jgi:hypothetical protein
MTLRREVAVSGDISSSKRRFITAVPGFSFDSIAPAPKGTRAQELFADPIDRRVG